MLFFSGNLLTRKYGLNFKSKVSEAFLHRGRKFEAARLVAETYWHCARGRSPQQLNLAYLSFPVFFFSSLELPGSIKE